MSDASVKESTRRLGRRITRASRKISEEEFVLRTYKAQLDSLVERERREHSDDLVHLIGTVYLIVREQEEKVRILRADRDRLQSLLLHLEWERQQELRRLPLDRRLAAFTHREIGRLCRPRFSRLSSNQPFRWSILFDVPAGKVDDVVQEEIQRRRDRRWVEYQIRTGN